MLNELLSDTKTMYKISRVWNCFAYLVIHIGRKMIWDYTGRNKSILTKGQFFSKYAQDIMCGR